MTDGQELTGRLGAVRVPCRELALEKVLQLSCRESKGMSVPRLPHTTLRHCKNTLFFNGPFLN